ncbi:MAG: DnaJ domain-containing protein [Candidatus Absconditabacteria bacterium]
MTKDSLFKKLKVDGSYTSKEVSILSGMINDSSDLSIIKDKLSNKKSNFAKFVMNDILKANIYSLATPNNQTKLVEMYDLLRSNFPQESELMKDKILIINGKISNYNNKTGIQLIQICLNILNNNNTNNELLKIDGKFGSKTFLSLLNYHLSSNHYKNSGAKIDGIVGKSTLDSMIAELKGSGNNEKEEQLQTNPVEQIEENSQYDDKPKIENLQTKKQDKEDELIEYYKQENQEIQETQQITEVDEIEATTKDNQNEGELIVDNEEPKEYYTKLLGYSKDGRKYLIGQDGNPKLFNANQLAKDLKVNNHNELMLFKLIQDLSFVLDAYSHQTGDNKLLNSFNDFLMSNQDYDAIVGKRNEIINVIGDKYNKVIHLVDGDSIEDDFTLQSVFQIQNDEERKNYLYKYVRENIGNYELVSSNIIDNKFNDFFQNISDESLSNFNKELESSATKGLTNKILNAKQGDSNGLYFAIKSKFNGNGKLVGDYIKSLQDKLIEAKKYFIKNEDIVRQEIEKQFTLSGQIPSNSKRKEIIEFTRSRIEYQYVTHNLKNDLFLGLNIFDGGYKGQDQELKMLSGIHGIGFFDLSDKTKSLGSGILEFLLIEAIAFGVGMFTVGLGYGLIHGVAGLRYLNNARKLYSGSTIFRGGVKTVNFGMEGLLFYQGANLVHNIVESRGFFEGAGNLKEIGKTILFLKLMSGLGQLMNKVPGLAISGKEMLSSKVFKLSGQTLIEGVGIGLVGGGIDVYLEGGEWNVESFIDGLLLAIMVKSMGKPVAKIQKGTEKFIIKNLNGSVQLLVASSVPGESQTTKEIQMAKNKYSKKEIFEPTSIIKPQISESVTKPENISEKVDLQEQVIEVKINIDGDTVPRSSKIDDILKESSTKTQFSDRIQKVKQNKVDFLQAKEVGNMNFYTDVLNGSTTSIVVIKNTKGKQFVLTSDFLPNSSLSKRGLIRIKNILNYNKGLIGDIEQVSIVTTTDVSKVNVDFQKVVNEVDSLLGVKANVKVVEYSSKDFMKSKVEDGGKLSLDIYENGMIQIVLSGKILEFETGMKKSTEKEKTEKKIEVKYDRSRLLKEVEGIVSQGLIIKDSVTKLEIIALKLKHKNTVNIKSITREINEIRTKLNKLTGIAERVKGLDEIKINNIDQLIVGTKKEFDRINDRIREIGTEIIANSSNHYQLLGVPKNASLAEIRKARNELLRIFHQDFSGSREINQKINDAYDVLKDSKKRMEYDMLII